MTLQRTFLPAAGPLAIVAILVGSAWSAAAEGQTLRALRQPATPIAVGAAAANDTVAPIEGTGRVVFRNDAGEQHAARVRPRRRQRRRLPHRWPDRRALPPGPVRLAAGAEMECTVQPGSYRYSAYTQRSGAVEQHKSKLRVR